MGSLGDFINNLKGKSSKEKKKERRKLRRKIDRKLRKIKKYQDKLKEEARSKKNEARELLAEGNKTIARRKLRDYRQELMKVNELNSILSVLKRCSEVIINKDVEEIMTEVSDSEVLDIDIEALAETSFELEVKGDEIVEANKIIREFDELQKEKLKENSSRDMPSIEELTENLRQEIDKEEKIREEERKIDKIKEIIDNL